MDLSFVIVSFNGRDHLRRCLTSIYEHTKDIDFEVIIVDNASADGTPEMVVAEYPQTTLVRRSENAGFAYAVNQGITVASGDNFLILNPDAELLSNAALALAEELATRPDVGVLAPKIVDADGALQLSCRAFPAFSTALFNRYSLLTRIFGRNRFSSRYLMTDFDHTETADVDWASAACWAVPRRAFEKVGPLDDSYFWTIEDVDYCQRVHCAGLRVVYFPDVAVRHLIGGSSRTLPYRTVIARHRGMWRYYRSYLRPKSVLTRPFVDASVWAGIQARCALHLAMTGVKRLIRGND